MLNKRKKEYEHPSDVEKLWGTKQVGRKVQKRCMLSPAIYRR
jgi:hypothetical protein